MPPPGSGIRDFFKRHRAAAVGSYPTPMEQEQADEDPSDLADLDLELTPEAWRPLTPSEAPGKPGEIPSRFIDGSHLGHAVLSVRAPEIGCVVPLMLAEVGGVAMNVEGRGLVRDFFGLERVLSLVADLFPWDQVETLSSEFASLGTLPLRLLPANRPDGGHVFDYEQMRKQAQNRTNQEMADWEALALASDRERAVLVDGRLEPRLRKEDAASRPLVIGVIKQHAVPYLHPQATHGQAVLGAHAIDAAAGENRIHRIRLLVGKELCATEGMRVVDLQRFPVRRLRGLLQDSDGVLRRQEPRGCPLLVPDSEPTGPLVIDLFGVRDAKLKRFVVAAVFHQLVEKRSGNAVEGLRYLVTLDELNRFAPKGASDPITEMIERVAAEMRSQGIILLGAQQEASRVSPRVIENSGVRAVGRSGTLELTADVWRFLGSASRSQAAQIQQDEKLLVLPSFRAPMLARIPFPPWALRKEEAVTTGPAGPGSLGLTASEI